MSSDTIPGSNETIADAKSAAASGLSTFKDQAAQAADTAKGTLNSIASEARGRINSMVDQQKAAGADQLSGLAKAAQTAAGDLQDKSPQVARLIGDAASSVDRFAGDLRGRDVRDVLGQVAGFARQQPVAFFAGSVLAGLLLARFLKSESHGASYAGPASVDDGNL